MSTKTSTKSNELETAFTNLLHAFFQDHPGGAGFEQHVAEMVTAGISQPLVAMINELVENGGIEFEGDVEGDVEGDGHLPDLTEFGQKFDTAATMLNQMIDRGLIKLKADEDGYLQVIS